MDYFDFEQASAVFRITNKLAGHESKSDQSSQSPSTIEPAVLFRSPDCAHKGNFEIDHALTCSPNPLSFSTCRPQYASNPGDVLVSPEGGHPTYMANATSSYTSILLDPELGNLASEVDHSELPVLTSTSTSILKRANPSRQADFIANETAATKDHRRVPRHRRDAVLVLKAWFSDNVNHPYPTEEQHKKLQELTGLQRHQILNWLANTRRRSKLKPQRIDPASTARAMDVPRRTHGDWHSMTPMDRWKSSPPENEAALFADIAQAVVDRRDSGTHDAAFYIAMPQSYSSSKCSSFDGEHYHSDGNFATESGLNATKSSYSGSSVNSFATASSQGGNDSPAFAHAHRRRRRRKIPIQRSALKPREKDPPRKFHCTFCTESFSVKYDWQRHERSLHMALDRWTCCSRDGMLQPEIKSACTFCGKENPTAEHLEIHNYSSCAEKPPAERTFYRKDHLRQHLKLVHGCQFNELMQDWRSTKEDIKSRCGFCSIWLDTWQQRVDHLATHFKNGLHMGHWIGDRGFDPDIEATVQNSIPAHVIDHERRTMNPYVARSSSDLDMSPDIFASTNLFHGTHVTIPGHDTKTTDGTSATCGKASDAAPAAIARSRLKWGQPNWNLWKLTGEALHAHVEACLSESPPRIPSDQELRDHARLVMFETTDPLDWTAADEAGWLAAFKYHAGIGDMPNQAQLATMPTTATNARMTNPTRNSKAHRIRSARFSEMGSFSSKPSTGLRPGTPFQSNMSSPSAEYLSLISTPLSTSVEDDMMFVNFDCI